MFSVVCLLKVFLVEPVLFMRNPFVQLVCKGATSLCKHDFCTTCVYGCNLELITNSSSVPAFQVQHDFRALHRCRQPHY